MEEANVTDLKNKRRSFKAQITTFGKWLETYVDSAKEHVKLRERIERLRTQFEIFNRIQDELSSLENFEESEIERQAVTDNYDDVMATAIVLFERRDTRATQTSPASTDQATTSSSSYGLSVKLPKIDLPKFDGRIETWITFKDAFNTLIHTQPGLNKIQKLNYLRLSLSGKAETAIGAFSITEDNYEAAWSHLKEIYDNKRALVLRHAALLRDTPAMPDESSESIRDLANHMQLHIRSLQALGRSPNDIGNDLLASILISKMGPEIRKSWERTLSDTEVPKIDELFKFLHNASHQSKEYETITKRTPIYSDTGSKTRTILTRSQYTNPRTQAPPQQKRQTYVTNASRNPSSPPSSPRAQRRSIPPSQRSTKGTGHPETKCPVCHEIHAIYLCPRFFELTVPRRIEAVRKARLCLNCLQADHRPEECKAGGCRVCNQRHNTKLHQDSSTPES